MKFGKMIDTITGKKYLRGVREDNVTVQWTDDGICYDMLLTVDLNGNTYHNTSQVAITKEMTQLSWTVKDITLDLIEEIKKEY
jgi:hypothetical protein